MAVLVNNIQDRIEVSAELQGLLEEIGNYLLRLEGQAQNSEVSIILVDNSYIRELNLTYRGEDRATDVLAFNLQDEMSECEEEKIIGDVVISLEKAEEQARFVGHSFQREVAFLAVHGILHLLGYDHGDKESRREMQEKQDMVMNKFKLE